MRNKRTGDLKDAASQLAGCLLPGFAHAALALVSYYVVAALTSSALAAAAGLGAVTLLHWRDSRQGRRYVRGPAARAVSAAVERQVRAAAAGCGVRVHGVLVHPHRRSATWLTAGRRGGWLLIDPQMPEPVLTATVYHELAHGRLWHCERRIAGRWTADAVVVALAVVGVASPTSIATAVVVGSALCATQLRRYEYAADRASAQQAGPEAFSAMCSFYSRGDSPVGPVVQLLSTHPGWPDRLRRGLTAG